MHDDIKPVSQNSQPSSRSSSRTNTPPPASMPVRSFFFSRFNTRAGMLTQKAAGSTKALAPLDTSSTFSFTPKWLEWVPKHMRTEILAAGKVTTALSSLVSSRKIIDYIAARYHLSDAQKTEMKGAKFSFDTQLAMRKLSNLETAQKAVHVSVAIKIEMSGQETVLGFLIPFEFTQDWNLVETPIAAAIHEKFLYAQFNGIRQQHIMMIEKFRLEGNPDGMAAFQTELELLAEIPLTLAAQQLVIENKKLTPISHEVLTKQLKALVAAEMAARKHKDSAVGNQLHATAVVDFFHQRATGGGIVAPETRESQVETATARTIQDTVVAKATVDSDVAVVEAGVREQESDVAAVEVTCGLKGEQQRQQTPPAPDDQAVVKRDCPYKCVNVNN